MSASTKIKSLFAFIITIGIISIAFYGYNLWNGYPNNFSKKQYIITATKNSNLTTFAEKMAKDGIINNKDLFLFKSKIKTVDPLQLGDYSITVPASSEEIMSQIDAISADKVEEVKRLASIPTVSVTFKEGLVINQMGDILEQKGVLKKNDFLTFVRDPKNVSKFNFDFLPKSLDCNYGDLKNCANYYFEGYLYPDTYSFFKNMKPDEVVNKLLINFDTKVWQKLKTKPDSSSFYKTMTLASVLEKESGRTKGVTDNNRNELQNERSNIAGALINRTNQGIKWQSDVTASYGHGYDICQQTFEIEGCKYLDDPLTATKYNTYIIKGYPIGPLSNPDFDNISAALNPVKNDYIFFVADVTGKVYFANDDTGHSQNIEKVKQINRELGL
jgi:UPF0755 protein